jgi:hypothetical protein
MRITLGNSILVLGFALVLPLFLCHDDKESLLYNCGYLLAALWSFIHGENWEFAENNQDNKRKTDRDLQSKSIWFL